jgi:iron complex transport system permease protein
MKKKYHLILTAFCSLLLIMVLALDLSLGSVQIPFKETLHILLGNSNHMNWSYIVLQIRLPRILTAVLAGSGLAVTGLMMQTYFRNPLAGPYVLGISSGASLGVAAYVMSFGIFGFASWSGIYNSGLALSAVLGSITVFALIMLIAYRIRDSVSLLIVGIMFGSLATAIVSIFQYFSRPELVQKFVIWTLGSLSSSDWKQILIMICFVLPGVVLLLFLIKPMNALLLGEMNAKATGVNLVRTRYLILSASSIIAGALTAFTGPIAFIGIIVPHGSKMILNTTNHRLLVPICMINGAFLLLCCDLISQVPGTYIVLPINAITALFGAPVVLWIILGKRKIKTTF